MPIEILARSKDVIHDVQKSAMSRHRDNIDNKQQFKVNDAESKMAQVVC